jgi:hypothetical protein
MLKNKLNCCPIFFLFEALEKIKPIVGLKFHKKKQKKKVLKVTAIPFFLAPSLQYKKAVFWLSRSIQLRSEKRLISKVSNELYAVNILKSGESLKKKKELYKYAVMFKTAKNFKW